jgi:hypothetical protein
VYRKATSILVITLVLAVVSPSIVFATISTDPCALPAFRNHITFTAGSALSGSLDYAVYAPGFYDGSLSLPPDEYVYCYQVFDSPGSTVNIDYFSVGLYPGITVGNLTYDPAHPVAVPGGTNPSFEFPLSQTVLYLFSVSPITPNSHSSVLLFTSEDAPTMAFGAVSGGYTGGAVVSLPTPDPIPEPASLLLLMLATPALVNKGRRIIHR